MILATSFTIEGREITETIGSLFANDIVQTGFEDRDNAFFK